MKSLVSGLALAITATAALAQSAVISPNGSRKSVIGPAANFTGTVLVDPLYPANEHLPQTGGLVTFTPGARSDWHTHPAGQILIVTAGTGYVQEAGGVKREVKPGDVIWTPPGVKHWHGAAESTSMSHIAISNMKDGKNVDWLEKVTDEQYAAK